MKKNSEGKNIITAISWERIFLNITIEQAGSEKYVFKNCETGEVVIIPGTPDKEKGQLVINLAAVAGRSFLGNGEWFIGVMQDGEFVHCELSEQAAYSLEATSKVFRYEKDKAYTVSFNVYSTDEKNLYLILNSSFMKENKNWQKKSLLTDRTLLFKKGIDLLYRLLRLFHKADGKNLLLMSETKAYLYGNLAAIDRRLRERGLDREYRIDTSFRYALGEVSRLGNWIRLIVKVAKADIIFIDDYCRIFNYIDLDKKTELVQVWHAGGGFKAVGYCRFGKNGSPHPVLSSHRKYTYVATGSASLKKVFSEVFGIEEASIIPTGMPRLDGYLDEEVIATFKETFYSQHPDYRDKKIILFCPTFRGKRQEVAYYDFGKLDLKRIYDFCRDEYIFMIKLHPFIKEKLPLPEEYQDRISDFSEYPDINELYYIADILITDYSSSFYEYSLLRKPMLFYTYDRCVYENTRGVYRYVKAVAPGKVCDDFDELLEALKNKDYEFEKVAGFIRENFGEYDGKATDKLIEQIILKNKQG